MTTITQTISAAGASTQLRLRRDEAALVTIDATGGNFEGTVQVEESRNGNTWAVAKDRNGVAQTYTFAQGAESTGVVCAADMKNTSGNTLFYRVNATVVVQDPVDVTLAESANEIVAVVLRDHLGRPVIGVRADAGLQFIGAGPIVMPNVSGVSAFDALPTLPGQSTRVSEHVDDVTIVAAAITATTGGNLGHANGYPLVAAKGADVALELVSALLVYDRATATYGDGGDLTINLEAGGAALTGLVAAADSIGAAADKVALFRPLTTAAELLTANKGINLVSSGAFTNPGTAAGVVRVRVRYRLHTLLLS